MKPPDSSDKKAPGLNVIRTVPALAALPLAESTNQRRRARLVTPVNANLNIELEPGITRVGRQRDTNDIVLVSPHISRRHAEILVRENQIWLYDVGSAYGTSVNGQRTTTRRLRPGDQISFADEFMFWLLVELEPQRPESRTLAAVSEPTQARSRPAGIPARLRRRLDELASGDALIPWLRPQPLPPPHPMASCEPTELEVVPEESGDSVTNVRAPRRQRVAFLSEEVPHLAPLMSSDPGDQLHAALLQLHQRCSELTSTQQVETLLIAALARATGFERGFFAYALPSGDWRLVTYPAGRGWAREEVIELVRLSTRLSRLSIVTNSATSRSLGCPSDGHPDSRLLLPLHDQDMPVGAVFLIGAVGAFDNLTADFFELFAQIATAALLER